MLLFAIETEYLLRSVKVQFLPQQAYVLSVLLFLYPGARGGRAIADLLFGKESPSGKLPITFYKDLEGMPEFTDYSHKSAETVVTN